MTAPGVDQSAQVEVMEFMQGPALVLIAPLIASWFAAVTDVIDTRTVGLVTLWTVAAAQAWLGVALWTRSIRPRTNSSRRGQGRATVTSP